MSLLLPCAFMACSMSSFNFYEILFKNVSIVKLHSNFILSEYLTNLYCKDFPLQAWTGP